MIRASSARPMMDTKYPFRDLKPKIRKRVFLPVLIEEPISFTDECDADFFLAKIIEIKETTESTESDESAKSNESNEFAEINAPVEPNEAPEISGPAKLNGLLEPNELAEANENRKIEMADMLELEGPSHSQAGAAGGRRLLMNGGGTSPEGPRPPPRNISPDPQRAGPSNGEAGLPEAVAGALVVSELEYRDGQVVSGTLEALIDLLRPGADRNFIFAFLLCSRIYVRPHELLATLCRRHTLTGQVHLSGEPVADVALAEMTSLVRLLGEWTRNFPYDFRDDRVMALVRNIAQTCASEEMSSLRDEMSLLLQKLLDRLTALEKYESTLNDIPYAPSIHKTSPNDVMTTGLSPMALARQLTLLELHLLSFVGPEEFIQAFIQTTRDTMHLRKTRNLEAYRKWFNRLNYLVVTDILKSAKTKPRAKILEHWILCARECFNLGNFNSLMAIVGALNMICISRLKKTWGRCSNVIQQLPPLERCMEPSANHARYRAALAAANGSTHPAVPCFSITCRDLHFINQTSRNWVSGNRINLDKCRSLARHISEQLSHVHTDTGFVRHNDTWEYLLKTPILSETTMEIASFEREPPNDHSEKDLYKSLRNNLR